MADEEPILSQQDAEAVTQAAQAAHDDTLEQTGNQSMATVALARAAAFAAGQAASAQ